MSTDSPRTLRCAIYTRKSSEEGLEQSFNSLDAQREACAAFILSQRHEGWTEIVTRYDDGGFSGGNMTRPALAALMRDIDKGLVDSVVVYKVDRLTRSLADFAKIVDCFDAKKISFVSVTQQFNTTSSMGRLTLNVLLSFAQFEREVTGERIRDKIAASKKKGMWMGGRVPMGYDVIDRKLVVNESEAAAVRHIFHRYVATGCVRSLKAELDDAGIASKVRVSRTGKASGGVPYSRGALYELLQNRLYIGETNHKKVAYPGEHARIIEPELWDAVQVRLRENTQGLRTGVRAKAPSMLVGKVFTDAGDRLIPSHSVKGAKRYRYYVTEPGARKNVRLAANDIERCVLEILRALLSSTHELAEALGIRDEAGDQQALVGEAQRLLDEPRVLEQQVAQTVLRVIIDGDDCDIHFSRQRLRDLFLVTGFDEAFGTLPVVRSATFRSRRSQHGLRLMLSENSHSGQGRLKVSSPLVKAAARGRHWYEELISGRGASLRSLAASSGVNDRYTSRILRCAFLAPDLVERLLNGDISDEQTLKGLLARLPRRWEEQRNCLPD